MSEKDPEGQSGWRSRRTRTSSPPATSARRRTSSRVREASREAGRALPVVAKLERRRALDHLDEIVLESDGVMVARGDLGGRDSAAPGAGGAEADHRGPVGRHARPVIVATQMLEIDGRASAGPPARSPRDVANAGLRRRRRDDALRRERVRPLPARGGAERCTGSSPSRSATTSRRHTSQPVGFHTMEVGPYDIEPPHRPGTLEIPETVSAAAILSARHLTAQGIVVLSQGGFTARQVGLPPALDAGVSRSPASRGRCASSSSSGAFTR